MLQNNNMTNVTTQTTNQGTQEPILKTKQVGAESNKNNSLNCNNLYNNLNNNLNNKTNNDSDKESDNDLEYDNDFIYLNDDEIAVYNPIKKDYKSKYKNVYCVNCGEKGHVVKDCSGPITSFGIIAFKVTNNQNDEFYDTNDKLKYILNNIGRRDTKDTQGTQDTRDVEKKLYPNIKFLMIQRKDTMGFTDFVRGKYPDDPEKTDTILPIFINEMTKQEKHNLLTKSFDEIWNVLWVNHDSKCFKNEYEIAYKKYQRLNIPDLIAKSNDINFQEFGFEFQEFGFPKGRRNMKETNIACAEREFLEETGYDKSCYDFIKNYPTIHEEFMGTNGIEYRHIYYLVKMKDDIPPPKIDYKNKIQTGEVQNIGWLSYRECMNVIRPYDTAKKTVVKKVYDDIVSMNHNYVCSNFYYTSKRYKMYNNPFQKRSPYKGYKSFYKNFQPKSV